MPEQQQEELRIREKLILDKPLKMTQNISSIGQKLLKYWQKDKTIKNIPVYKDNATVIMDYTIYNQGTDELFNEGG